MKTVAFTQAGPIDRPNALMDLDLPIPQPQPLDLQVKVQAIALNPVDTKVRANRSAASADNPQVIGWDAVGVVDAVGEQVRGFKLGDRVFYMGEIGRAGSYAEFQLVDHRVAGHAPAQVANAPLAAMPLTTLTAWELLFERLGVIEGGGQGQALLVVGAAGGVGSVLIQLARQLTQLTIIATASRPETRAWVKAMGAHHIISHNEAFWPQLQALGLPQVDYTASLNQTGTHLPAIVAASRVFAKVGFIDDPKGMDVMPMKAKSMSLHHEFVFARTLHQTPDVHLQGHWLTRVGEMMAAGQIVSTMTEQLGPINATNLTRAHVLQESGRVHGKLVLEGF
jgi:zinc-binding alcohol dehydrogenase family protein